MITSAEFLAEEFWWLQALGKPCDGWVEVGRSIWTPPTENPGWVASPGRLSLDQLYEWASKNRWTNVHRSLAVYQSPLDGDAVVGPFLIDIDMDEECLDDFSTKAALDQLRRAHSVAQRVVRHYLDKGIAQTDIRSVFSGHKGFHIELVLRSDERFFRPPELLDRRRGIWQREVKRLRSALGEEDGGCVDPPHKFVRLRHSWNQWSNRQATSLPLSIEELSQLSIEEILSKAHYGAILPRLGARAEAPQ